MKPVLDFILLPQAMPRFIALYGPSFFHCLLCLCLTGMRMHLFQIFSVGSRRNHYDLVSKLISEFDEWTF